jgi:hypothetical protein
LCVISVRWLARAIAPYAETREAAIAMIIRTRCKTYLTFILPISLS